MIQDKQLLPPGQKKQTSIRISELTALGKFMVLVVGPMIAIVVFYFLVVIGGVLLGAVVFAFEIELESLSKSTACPIVVVAFVLTALAVTPVSRRVHAWCRKRGIQIVAPALKDAESLK